MRMVDAQALRACAARGTANSVAVRNKEASLMNGLSAGAGMRERTESAAPPISCGGALKFEVEPA